MTSSNTEPQRPRYPDTWNSRAGERRCAIGDPCDACLDEKCEEAPKPAPNDALGELTTLILGKTATAAAQAVLAAGYAKKWNNVRTTPCCGKVEVCRDCPTD